MPGAAISSGRGSGCQILVEPIQRVLPGFLGRCFVVTGRRVIVEAVIGGLVDVTLVRHVRGVERGIECLRGSNFHEQEKQEASGRSPY